MRRLLLGCGMALTLGAAGAYAAADAWLDARVTAELGGLASRLPPGASLSWQSAGVELLGGEARIRDLVLDLGDNGPVRGLEAGEIQLAQATLGTGGTIDSLGRAKVTNVKITLADGGEVSAASIVGKDLDVQALTKALGAPEGLLQLIDGQLGPVEIEQLAWMMPEEKFTAARLAISGYGNRRLEGLAAKNIQLEVGPDKRLAIADLQAGRIDAAALSREPWPEEPVELFRLFDRNELSGIVVTGVNVIDPDGTLGIASFRLGHLGGGRLEELALEQLGGAGKEGGRFSLQRFALAKLDWRKLDLDRLAATIAALEGAAAESDDEVIEEEEQTEEEPLDEEAEAETDGETDGQEVLETFAGLEIAAQLMKLEIGEIRIEGLTGGDDNGRLTLDRYVFGGMGSGKFGGTTLARLGYEGADGWTVRLDEASQDPVAMPVEDFVAKLEQTSRTVEGLAQYMLELYSLSWQGRSGFKGLSVQKGGLTGFGIGSFAIELGTNGRNKRTDFYLDDMLIDSSAFSDQPGAQSMQALGVDRLVLSSRFKSLYDGGAHNFQIETFAVEAPGIGSSDFKLQTRLGSDPTTEPMVAMTEAVLLGAELVYRDAGFAERMLQNLERESGQKRAALAAELVRGLRADEPMRTLIDNQRAGQLEAFLKKPRLLVVSIKPRRQVPFTTLMMSGMADPKQLASALGLEIKASDR